MSDAWVRRRPLPPDLRKISQEKILRPVRTVPVDLYRNLPPGVDPLPALVEYVQKISYNTDIDVLIRTLGTSFSARAVTVGTTPVEVIPRAKYPRGYFLINPATVGFVTTVTYFASALRAAIATFNSGTQDVSGVATVRLFLDITAVVGVPTLTIAYQTRDPVSLNFATSQADIFAGFAAVGTRYADMGEIGTDQIVRLQAVVGVAATSVTFSVGGVHKGGAIGSFTGVGAIYLGGSSVNPTIGFPLLGGQRESLFLRENANLFAVADVAGVTLKIFELQ